MISFSQFFFFGSIAKHADKWPTSIHTIINDMKSDVLKDIEGASISIKIESNGDTIEIKAKSNKKDLEKELEDLESGNKQKDDTIKKVK
jgi:hypothetical protein